MGVPFPFSRVYVNFCFSQYTLHCVRGLPISIKTHLYHPQASPPPPTTTPLPLSVRWFTQLYPTMGVGIPAMISTALTGASG